ncbi:MAG: HAD family phosphatase [Clostridia bacterium]|nr:HAD family phosphatase [Clostridia bacterium]
MNTKYLFFDLDGTISFDGDTVAPKELEAIAKVKEMGHKVFINTGRGLAHISKNILNALEWDGVIAGSAYMQLHGKEVYAKYISKETVRCLYEYCKKENAVGIFEGRSIIYTSFPYPVTQVLLNDENITDGMEIISVNILNPISFEEAQSLFPDMELVVYGGHFEGTSKGHSKESCMKILTHKFGIPKKDMIAFGDGANDKEMLKYAGMSVAVGKAPKEFDEFVSMRTDNVADALKKLFDI